MSIRIDLEDIVNGGDKYDNFTSQLLRLIMEADGINKVKLGHEFPNAVAAVVLFQETGQIRDFPQD